MREWRQNPSLITFKPSADEQRQKLGINDISYFEIEGIESYKRFTLDISMGEVNINKLSNLPDTSGENHSAFLKLVYDGDLISLLIYRYN